MRVVLLPAVAGRETGQIMTNSRKRHTPEQVVRKLGQADRMLADGQDVAAGVTRKSWTRPAYAALSSVEASNSLCSWLTGVR